MRQYSPKGVTWNTELSKSTLTSSVDKSMDDTEGLFWPFAGLVDKVLLLDATLKNVIHAFVRVGFVLLYQTPSSSSLWLRKVIYGSGTIV
jgi:hypothetical protein